jgi:hypothetical protein
MFVGRLKSPTLRTAFCNDSRWIAGSFGTYCKNREEKDKFNTGIS